MLRSVGVGARLFSTTEAEEVSISKQSVEAGVGLTTLAHEASEGNDGVLGTSHLSVFVNLQLRGVLTWAISICTEAWSLAAMSLLVAEHLRGMYRSTIFPSSFCMFS